MDNFLQPPQPHRHINEIAAIIFPIFAQPTGSRGEQIDHHRINPNAAIQNALNIIEQVISFHLQRERCKSVNLFCRNFARSAAAAIFAGQRMRRHQARDDFAFNQIGKGMIIAAS
ncbi:MAG: hypothetical protein BVN32_12760 [Proteobacteria bacterium ST_bin14]|nr:MAG: hypothetical protein BVN32_12760 [Proteobacteria bacterium ST_bin14]